MRENDSLYEQAGHPVMLDDPEMVTEADISDDVPGPWVCCTAGYDGCTYGGWAAEMVFYTSLGEWTCPSCDWAINSEDEQYRADVAASYYSHVFGGYF